MFVNDDLIVPVCLKTKFTKQFWALYASCPDENVGFNLSPSSHEQSSWLGFNHLHLLHHIHAKRLKFVLGRLRQSFWEGGQNAISCLEQGYVESRLVEYFKPVVPECCGRIE